MHPRPPLVPSGIKGFIPRDPCPTWVTLMGARRCCYGVALNRHFVPSIPVTSPAARPTCLHLTPPCTPRACTPCCLHPTAPCTQRCPVLQAALHPTPPCTPRVCTPHCLHPHRSACRVPASHVSALHAVLHAAPHTVLHPTRFDPRCLRIAGLEPVISGAAGRGGSGRWRGSEGLGAGAVARVTGGRFRAGISG